MKHRLKWYLSRYLKMAIDDLPDDPDLQELLLDYLRDEDGQGEVLDKGTAQQLRKTMDTNKVYDGMKCSKCNEWFPQSEPNQDDGESFICYLCRMYG